MASDVSICNLALSRIGVSITISAIDEGSDASNKCQNVIEHVRERVLDDFDWRFASRQATLAVLGTAPTGWDYQYAYPSDCVAPREIVYDGVINSPDMRIRWTIGYDVTTDAKVILTDEEDAELRYTKLITNPMVYPNYFVEAFAWAMAMELVTPMAASSTFAKAAGEAYRAALTRAEARALEAGEEGPLPDSEFIQARG